VDPIRPNIVLIGYRGTGKSTIGRILAQRLNRPLVSTDEAIVRRAGAAIPDIVKRHGWDWFREQEAEVVRETAGRAGLVVDCGGGAVLRETNRDALRATGVVVWLQASVPAIMERIQADDQRPSLTGRQSFLDEVGEVLRQREPLYRSACHFAVNTDGRSPEEIAAEIFEELQRREVC